MKDYDSFGIRIIKGGRESRMDILRFKQIKEQYYTIEGQGRTNKVNTEKITNHFFGMFSTKARGCLYKGVL